MAKNSLMIIILFFLTCGLYSQEISCEYELKKLKAPIFKKVGLELSGERVYNENDKITLYADGSYFRKIYNNFHQLESYEEKGEWKIKEDSLILKMEEIRIFPEYDELWKKFNRLNIFLIKRNKIIPVFYGHLYRDRKLKLN